MRRRHALVIAAIGFVASGIACVDLFHSTDFETLCTHAPSDPRCASDAPVGADVVVKETGSDAERPPHANFCLLSSTEASKQALHACAWLGACEGSLQTSTLGECAVRAQLAYDCKANPTLRPAGEADNLWGCLATVTSCDEVDRCVFPSPSGADTCAAGSDTAKALACGNSNPKALIHCQGTEPGRAVGVEPCALLGQTCAKSTGPGVLPACSGTQGFGKCTTSTCAGTSAVDCASGGQTSGSTARRAAGRACWTTPARARSARRPSASKRAPPTRRPPAKAARSRSAWATS